MNYCDSVDQPIAPGDWVVYAKSGYARIAKILEIKPTGRMHWNNTPEHKVVVMTAAEGKTYRREYLFAPWRAGKDKTYSLVRIDRPPLREENLIETRIARM